MEETTRGTQTQEHKAQMTDARRGPTDTGETGIRPTRSTGRRERPAQDERGTKGEKKRTERREDGQKM